MRRSLIGISMALLATATLLVACSDESSSPPSTTRTSSSAETTEPSSSSPSSTAGAPDTDEQPEQAIYPFAFTGATYPDPVPLARAFAVEYLGMSDPVVGEFQQGDSRSGEVGIRSRNDGPVTTVMLRQLEDDDWWVIGAATANLQIESPEALTTIGSPVTVSGRSTAFEATINLEVREDARLEPIAEGVTNGGSMGEMGPFSTSLDLGETDADGGAVVVKTLSPEDGGVAEASVVRILFR